MIIDVLAEQIVCEIDSERSRIYIYIYVYIRLFGTDANASRMNGISVSLARVLEITGEISSYELEFLSAFNSIHRPLWGDTHLEACGHAKGAPGIKIKAV